MCQVLRNLDLSRKKLNEFHSRRIWRGYNRRLSNYMATAQYKTLRNSIPTWEHGEILWVCFADDPRLVDQGWPLGSLVRIPRPTSQHEVIGVLKKISRICSCPKGLVRSQLRYMSNGQIVIYLWTAEGSVQFLAASEVGHEGVGRAVWERGLAETQHFP